MADTLKGNAVVGQSGGPTGVINASLVGVIEEVRKHPEIENLYGAVHAVGGHGQERFHRPGPDRCRDAGDGGGFAFVGAGVEPGQAGR